MKNHYIYLISALFVLLPVAAVRPMTSLFAETLDATMTEIGFITACYSVTPFLLAIFAGRFVDKYGEKIPILIGSVSLVIALILPYLFPVLLTLYISQLILGGAQLLAIVAIQNGVASSVPPSKRDQAFANMSLFTSLGLMFGPLIGGYSTEHLGFQHSFLLFVFFSIVPLVLSLIIKKSNQQKLNSDKIKTMGVRKLLSIPKLKLSIFISMINLAAIDIFNVYYPLYSSSIGMSPSEIGWILTITALASVAIRVFISTLTEKLGRAKLISIFMFCGAVSYLAVPLTSYYPLIILISILLGCGLGITQPLTTIVSYNLAPIGHTGEVLGIRLAGNRFSQIITPVIFAGISNLIGLGAIFIFEAILLGAGAVLAKGIRTREGPTMKKKPKIRSM
ncbi:MFS transporter [Robertmurraya yapensis]|uniref:MFS transporter n=1 Tax=Bacillus yapensis TaxID=2492960 RepID=A0A431WII4_9BACI|nr:MFS transporter [Bacillus yapensis]RTR35177.1 MFS transporter [Bacillus yapensis]TKS97686.1 MFS transporter [Bacillus yapensis]